MDGRSVDVFFFGGLADTNLLGLWLVGKKSLPGEQPVADLQLEVTSGGF